MEAKRSDSKAQRDNRVARLVILTSLLALSTAIGVLHQKLPLAKQTIAIGEFDPELIRGKMTLRDVITASEIPAKAFMDKFGVKEPDLDIPMKNLADKHDFYTEDVRDFVRQELQ